MHIARRRKLVQVEDCQDQLCARATINILPDYVLIEVFGSYLGQDDGDGDYDYDAWHTLVHVCQRWRYIVFTSPHRLNLRLLCTTKRPVITMLDIWPALPIVILADIMTRSRLGVTNVLAALEKNDCVCDIYIEQIPSSLLKRFAATKKPFPALTFLGLRSNDTNAPILPDSFLGGSAPGLREIYLDGIPFPGLGKLLLSTHNLVDLRLSDIPHSGYISPEAIVHCLSVLTRLESLGLGFRSPQSRPDRESRHPPPLTRVILPAVTHFSFKGANEYLEDVVSQIDVPLLDNVHLTFFNQLMFDTLLFSHFINRTETFKKSHWADVVFGVRYAGIKIYQPNGTANSHMLTLRISCRASDWQLSSLTQVCDSLLPLLRTLDRLEIREDRQHWHDSMESTEWLDLLRPFTSVRDLELSGNLVQLVAPALGELKGERVTDVLPALQNIFIEGLPSMKPVQEAIGQFVARRQLLGHPVTVRHEQRSWC